jgi:hypothetical protein
VNFNKETKKNQLRMNLILALIEIDKKLKTLINKKTEIGCAA